MHVLLWIALGALIIVGLLFLWLRSVMNRPGGWEG